jgi:transcriptional regulator of acetoin/glycerol metabolism
MSPQVLSRLLQHSWPGNVRELRNTINYAVAMACGSRIELGDLPIGLLEEAKEGQPLNIRQDSERQLIQKMLQTTHFNRSRTAVLLHMSRKTLYNKMVRYGLNDHR